jgi:hypothetical protein
MGTLSAGGLFRTGPSDHTRGDRERPGELGRGTEVRPGRPAPASHAGMVVNDRPGGPDVAGGPSEGDRNDNRSMLPWVVGAVALVAMLVYFVVGSMG